ncbi:hypothetical protein EDC04DRAFT_1263529 [Pisolithus marmoratus]|nr:hypothetical protein EDC04DRAFT_1263529 [Pisolithus marmoratus]
MGAQLGLVNSKTRPYLHLSSPSPPRMHCLIRDRRFAFLGVSVPSKFGRPSAPYLDPYRLRVQVQRHCNCACCAQGHTTTSSQSGTCGTLWEKKVEFHRRRTPSKSVTDEPQSDRQPATIYHRQIRHPCIPSRPTQALGECITHSDGCPFSFSIAPRVVQDSVPPNGPVAVYFVGRCRHYNFQVLRIISLVPLAVELHSATQVAASSQAPRFLLSHAAAPDSTWQAIVACRDVTQSNEGLTESALTLHLATCYPRPRRIPTPHSVLFFFYIDMHMGKFCMLSRETLA